MMNISEINTASPFRDLFPIEENIVKEIMWDIQKKGFDESKPIVLWKGKLIVIDGHTRLRAARKAGLGQVPVAMKDFDNEEAALEYAIKSQRNRRNLKDREILQCIAALDKRRIPGRPSNEKLASNDANFGKSAAKTASMLGISTCKVERARTVLCKAPEGIQEAVRSGKMTIHEAYQKTKNPTKDEEPELKPEEQKKINELFESIIKESLSKDQIKELIKKLVKEITQ